MDYEAGLWGKGHCKKGNGRFSNNLKTRKSIFVKRGVPALFQLTRSLRKKVTVLGLRV